MAGQHYVPKFYLDYFREEFPKIRQLDVRDCEKITEESTKNICTITDNQNKHSDHLEKELGVAESKYGAIFKDIRESCKLPEDRKLISNFLALTMVRNRYAYDHLINLGEGEFDPAHIRLEIYKLGGIIENRVSSKKMELLKTENPIPIPDVPIIMYSNDSKYEHSPEFIFFPLDRYTIISYYEKDRLCNVLSEDRILSLMVNNAKEYLYFNPDDKEYLLPHIKNILSNNNEKPFRIEDWFNMRISTWDEIADDTRKKKEKGQLISEEIHYISKDQLNKYKYNSFDN